MWLLKFFKWFLIFVISAIFVALLLSLTISFSFVEVTKPENVKPILYSVFASSMPKGQDFSNMQSQISFECENKTELQLPLGEGNDSVTINCNDIKNNKPLAEAIFDSLFNKIYYKDYGCSFLQCFKNENKNEPPLFLFSKISNDFFKNSTSKLAIAIIVVGIILLLLGGIRAVANNLITAGLPFIIMLLTNNSVTQQFFSKPEMQPLIPLISSLYPSLERLFAVFLAAGIVLLITSFILKKKAKSLLKKKPWEEKEIKAKPEKIKAERVQKVRERKKEVKTKPKQKARKKRSKI